LSLLAPLRHSESFPGDRHSAYANAYGHRFRLK
jgi:hypothetical protein